MLNEGFIEFGRRVCYCCGSKGYKYSYTNGRPALIRNRGTDKFLCTKCNNRLYKNYVIKLRYRERKIIEFATRSCYGCGKVGIEPTRCYFNPPTNLYLCNNCYGNLFLREKRWIYHKKRQGNLRRLHFLGGNVTLSKNPRTGVCNWCRAVRGLDCQRTVLHHDENKYDVEKPLAHTIEICTSCHRRETTRLKSKPVEFKIPSSIS